MDPHPQLPSTSEQQEPYRNWLDLPKDVAASIFLRLGAIEILTSVQHVCSTWHGICKDPSMWRKIDINYDGDSDGDDDWHLEDNHIELCKHAVDRSCGGLINISIKYFGTDDLLQYIADRSSNLKGLRLVTCYGITDEGLSQAASKLPLLEELEISYCNFSKISLDAVGNVCPLLKSLKLNAAGYKIPHIECDVEALAIAEKMPGLRHLQIFGNKLTNEGLRAILNGCQHLESLDLRQCFNVKIEGDLKRICAERIKDLRCPNDPTDDYPFNAEISEMESCDEDYPLGFSDIDFMSDDNDYYEFSGGSDISSDFDDLFFGY